VTTYTISRYEPYDDHMEDREGFRESDWLPVASGVRLFALRRYMRNLTRCGYEMDTSILIERDEAVAQRSLF